MPSLRFPVPYTLKSWTTPCDASGIGAGENLCVDPGGFLIPTADVCVTATFEEVAVPSHKISGNECPTGPGDS
jgi:hypothetical protein